MACRKARLILRFSAENAARQHSTWPSLCSSTWFARLSVSTICRRVYLCRALRLKCHCTDRLPKSDSDAGKLSGELAGRSVLTNPQCSLHDSFPDRTTLVEQS